MANNNYKLAVANRISMWLNKTTEGYNDNQFLHFTSENNPTEMQAFYNGLTYLKEKLQNLPLTQPNQKYLFIQKVTNGKAAAIYVVAPFLFNADGTLNERALTTLQANIIAQEQQWASDNAQTMNPPVFEKDLPEDGKPSAEYNFLVITVDLVKNTTSL